MLRLPRYRYHRPRRLSEALELLDKHGDSAMVVAGGTDLLPNMKHGLFEPEHLVALKGVEELQGIQDGDGELTLGAGETLTAVATHPQVRLHLSSLADAAGNVAGPQLRNMGTLGGNLCLDTRCTYYNQTRFWRHALGYCLKKDGDVCHVTRVGAKCVAAHSADTPPVLMTLDAVADVAGPGGQRTVQVRDFFVADGIWNSTRKRDEVVTRIRIPLPPDDLRTSYAKLRQRSAIDFPLLTVAVAARMDGEDRIQDIRGVVTALGARPRLLTGWEDIAVGEVLGDEVIHELAQRAHAQCHPLENIIVDPDWRRAMVPVYVRRALEGLRSSSRASAA